MIDPDYIHPFALCNKPRRVPYASPLPQVLKPRLPEKPVQIMPPSPHRQGRRGYELPPVCRELFWREWWRTTSSAAVVFWLLAVTTQGVALLIVPVLLPILVGNGVVRVQREAKMSCMHAMVFAIEVVAALGLLAYVALRVAFGRETDVLSSLLFAACCLLLPFVIVGALAGRDISTPQPIGED